MADKNKYIIGTSGFSFKDWIGEFYPPQTKPKEMFAQYTTFFSMTELNYTFYRMPSARTLASLSEHSPPGFEFWVKLNQQISHERDLAGVDEFVDNLAPLIESRKLAGILLQFPQSFKRTVENRLFLARVIDAIAPLPQAVEFRDSSWEHDSTYQGLREKSVALVVPDAPPIRSLFHPPPISTSPIAYLRLHSRNARYWYKGEGMRYDYDYSEDELKDVLGQWSAIEQEVQKIYTLFNNCNRGQAGRNAMAMRRILGQIK